MIFKRATQEDFLYVKQNPFEKAVKGYPYMDVPDESCYTIIFEDVIVGVGGLQLKWEGVGLLWLMLTANCKKQGIYGVLALDAIKEKTEHLIKINNLWRAEATVRTDFPQAIKMIEYFGFKRDGLMKKYNPDKTDSYLYSQVK